MNLLTYLGYSSAYGQQFGRYKKCQIHTDTVNPEEKVRYFLHCFVKQNSSEFVMLFKVFKVVMLLF